MDKTLYVYTDGGVRGNGKENNIGGWGIFKVYGDKTKDLYGGKRNTTNNEMELQACIEALKAIKNKKIKTIVVTDSRYVEQGITNWIFGWISNGWKTSSKEPVKNKELWSKLYVLKIEFQDISFELVKGHAEDEGNNMADELANKAMDGIGD